MYKPLLLRAFISILWIHATVTNGFVSSSLKHSTTQKSSALSQSRSTVASTTSQTVKAPPRTGFAQKALDLALQSPIWKYVLVPQARSTMVKTAESNGIPWKASKQWLKDNAICRPIEESEYDMPSYYKQAFHAYEDGNLSWDAALEVEIASCSVGARNFPQIGSRGEDAFRGAFESALDQAGATVPSGGRILDLGCGTGMSTRRLARRFQQAGRIEGIDLSPYFIEIGRQLLELQPKSFHDGGPWVSTIVNDDRIHYGVGDAADTKLEAESFDVVNLQFVLHELPSEIAITIVNEAFRVLKPNGQVWICEMDFEAPAYAEQRANAMLFSLIRSTEPYLDDYAESITNLFDHVQSKFLQTTIVPATGRHFALVATKGLNTKSSEKEINKGNRLTDLRFNDDGTYRVEDTHLKVWESKQ